MRHSGSILAPKVGWRQVKPICDDPDQSYNARLKHIGECGLGWVAGVPFRIGTAEGIIVYMARDTTDEHKLQDPENSDYLLHASLMIGTAYALRRPRLVAEEARKAEKKELLNRVQARIEASMEIDKPIGDTVAETSGNTPTDSAASGAKSATGTSKHLPCGGEALNTISRKVHLTLKKFPGAANKAPAAFTWNQTAWTFAGVFLTLYILTSINTVFVENFGEGCTMIFGPIGALMALQYGLTAAPASQPRNAMLGQVIGLMIGHGIGNVPHLDLQLKQTLATSLAIGCMARLGLIHPPAGATALVFSDGRKTWHQVGMMLLGNLLAIFCATIINNLCEQRQYPTFWGFQPLLDLIYGNGENSGKKTIDKGQEEKKKNKSKF